MPDVLLAEDRELLKARISEARKRTDEIFALLKPGALYERPIPERHRLIFYLGHVEAFDWNLIARQMCGIEPFRATFDKLFAFGIDPVDGGLPNEPASKWPSESEVRAYNERVRAVVDECVLSPRAPRSELDQRTIIEMAIEHRLMHAETLAYLLHQLPYEAKTRPSGSNPRLPRGTAEQDRKSRDAELIQVPAGTAVLGMRRDSGRFGWDNEFEEQTVKVPAFSIEKYKITNGRFLEFVHDGGYRRRDLWSENNWTWREQQGLEHPLFWKGRDGSWLLRGMFGDRPLEPDEPVYVSHAEASAFARWSGRALPSEPQFHRAAYGTPEGTEREYPWGDAAPSWEHGNFDFHAWDPTPVQEHPRGDSAFGVSGMLGNGWEWTSSVFGPLPGFRSHPLYEGYSSNFFDGEHYVIKGGSPRTAACMLRRTFRNWFQPRYSYVYTGFRLLGDVVS